MRYGEDSILPLGGLEKVRIVLESIQALKRAFEGRKDISGNFMIRLTKDIGEHLDDAIECCTPLNKAEDA